LGGIYWVGLVSGKANTVVYFFDVFVAFPSVFFISGLPLAFKDAGRICSGVSYFVHLSAC
jgi:hypothetical protein